MTCDKKASVMAMESNGGKRLDVSVSDPTQTNSASINIIFDKTAKAVVKKDAQITVSQLSPVIKFTVNPNQMLGKAIKIKFDMVQEQK